MNLISSDDRVDDQLLELVSAAIESALEAIEKHGTLVPMAIVASDEGSSMVAFPSLTDDEITVQMRKYLQSNKSPSAYVLTFTGELSRGTLPPFPAVIVEGATVNMANSLQWAYPLADSEL